jgi:predicted Zn-dependent protease
MSDARHWLAIERQARTAVERQNWPLAEDRLRRLIEVAPDALAFVRLLAQVLREQERSQEAEVLLVDHWKRAPESDIEGRRELLLELADLRLATKRPAEAARAAKRILEHEPHQWEALYLLGNAFLDVGAVPEAINAYRESISSQPFEPEVWWNFSIALEKSGDLAGAADALEAWMKHGGAGFSDAEKKAALADIKRLRKATGRG